MISGVSQTDSEWWKTPRFIYGKVLESSGKFRVKPRKVWNILEGGGTGPAGPAPPGEAHQGLAGQGQAKWGRESFPPSMRVGEEGEVPPPHFLLVCSLSFPIWQVGV